MGEFLIQECISKEDECMYYYNEAVSFGWLCRFYLSCAR